MTQLTCLQILQVRHSLQAVQSAAAGTVSRTAAKLTDVAEDRKGSHRRLRLPWRRKHKQHEYGPKQSSGFFHFGGPEGAAKQHIASGQAAERALDIRAAAAAYEQVVKLLPHNGYWWACLAKQITDHTYLDFAPAKERLTDEERRSFNEKAIELAHKAKQTSPDLALPCIAACVSMGRLALLSDNKAKVRLAHDARLEAVRALELEPCNDLSHHLMGRWHYEMASLNMVVRTVIRVMYGTALAPGTFQEALASFERAAEIAPERLIHRVELGRCHDRLGNRSQALKELEAAMGMEVEDINCYLQRMDGAEMLKRLQRQQQGWGLRGLGSSQTPEPKLQQGPSEQQSSGN
eukprot:jgi/Astpho2/5256/fgenesh1_pg.00074_%23_61_t